MLWENTSREDAALAGGKALAQMPTSYKPQPKGSGRGVN